MTGSPGIERPDDLTAEWLTDALGAGTVESFTVTRIGTGQMSECYRIGLTYSDGDGPAVLCYPTPNHVVGDYSVDEYVRVVAARGARLAETLA